MNKAELAELAEKAWEAIWLNCDPYSEFPESLWRNLSHNDQHAVMAGIAAVEDRIRVEVRASMLDIMSHGLPSIIKDVETKLRKATKENAA